MGIWTIGRESEKDHATKYVDGDEQRSLIFDVIDAVEDIKAGKNDANRFIEVARTAYINGTQSVWDQTAKWIARVGKYYPEVHAIWDELANHHSWAVRFRVACVLYNCIPERQSHIVFESFRFDRSSKVREMAIERYEWTHVLTTTPPEIEGPWGKRPGQVTTSYERTRSASDFELELALAENDAQGTDNSVDRGKP